MKNWKRWDFAPLVFALLLIFAIFVSANPPNLEIPESANSATSEKGKVPNPGIATFAEHVIPQSQGGLSAKPGLTASATQQTVADAVSVPSRYIAGHTAYKQRHQCTDLYTPNLDEDATEQPAEPDATYQDTVYRTDEATASTDDES